MSTRRHIFLFDLGLKETGVASNNTVKYLLILKIPLTLT